MVYVVSGQALLGAGGILGAVWVRDHCRPREPSEWEPELLHANSVVPLMSYADRSRAHGMLLKYTDDMYTFALCLPIHRLSMSLQSFEQWCGALYHKETNSRLRLEFRKSHSVWVWALKSMTSKIKSLRQS